MDPLFLFTSLYPDLLVVFATCRTIYSAQQIAPARWRSPQTAENRPLTPISRVELQEEMPLIKRTSSRTVVFSHPFLLSGIGGIQPAGTYTVETDEELVQEISFPVYRRTATLMLLPPQPGGAALAQIATIDPLELEVALERDAMKGVP